MLNAFRDAMRDRGYLEGQNLTLYVAGREGLSNRIPAR
jgi:hypothetical protein